MLSIRRAGGIFDGTPRGQDIVPIGDVLILYGDLDDVEKLDRRRAGFQGDKEHRLSVEEQDEFEEKEGRRLQDLDAKVAIQAERLERVEQHD